jgi:hypothetical protein
MKSYKDFISESFVQNVVQNDKDPNFDGADPSSIEIHNRGIGGVNSLQGHRDQIVRLLEQMLADAKMAQKNHKLAHYSIAKILSLADPDRITGVLLTYLKNHQTAIEELEAIRRKGGSGAGKSIPKGLI